MGLQSSLCFRVPPEESCIWYDPRSTWIHVQCCFGINHDMCVHGGTKKGEVMQMLTYFQCKAKAFGDETRFAELETFRLDLVTLKV